MNARKSNGARNPNSAYPIIPKSITLPAIPSDVFERRNKGAGSETQVASAPPADTAWDDDKNYMRTSGVYYPQSQPNIADLESMPLPYIPRSTPVRIKTPAARSLLWQIALLVTLISAVIASVRFVYDPLGLFHQTFQSSVATYTYTSIASRVPTFIQIDPTIGYTSRQQYDLYSGADCSAAATSEVLTAWGDKTGNIGHVIEDMGAGLSPSGGLINVAAFQQVGQQEGFSTIVTDNIDINQLRKIVTTYEIPVIVGVRDVSGGYYSYFSPGHFLVVTGADSNGFMIVDSSTYFVHYLPTATFLSLWASPKAVIFTPASLKFSMPQG